MLNGGRDANVMIRSMNPERDNTKALIYLDSNDLNGIELARRLDLEIADRQNVPVDWHLVCHYGELALDHPASRLFTLSETSIQARLEGARESALAKACAANRRPRALDGLGGWGVDALALSSLGCEVTLTEINPLVCAMARDLCHRLGFSVVVECVDVVEFLRSSSNSFDVIYLDPIFPPHPTTALPARRMQVLESLATRDTDLGSLFELARDLARNRVVIKHRRKQSSMVRSPDWQVEGRTIRFDVFDSRT